MQNTKLLKLIEEEVLLNKYIKEHSINVTDRNDDCMDIDVYTLCDEINNRIGVFANEKKAHIYETAIAKSDIRNLKYKVRKETAEVYIKKGKIKITF